MVYYLKISLLCLAVLTLGFAQTATAQDSAASQASPPPAVDPAQTPVAAPAAAIEGELPGSPVLPTLESIGERIKGIQESPTLDKALQTRLIETYQEALGQLALQQQNVEKIDRLTRQIQSAPAQIQSIRAELAKPPAEVSIDLPADASQDRLNQAIQQAASEVADLKKRLADLEDRLKTRTDRRAELQKQMAALRQQLDEINRLLETAPPPEGVGFDPQRASRILLQTRKQAVQSQLNLLQLEAANFDVISDLLTVQRDQAVRQIAQKDRLLQSLRDRANRLAQEEAERAARQAVEARRKAARSAPVVQEVAEENARLAQLRTGPEGLATLREKAAAKMHAIDDQYEMIIREFRDVRQKVEVAGEVNSAIGLILLGKRNILPDLEEHAAQIRQRQQLMAETHFRWIELQEERSRLADLDAVVANILENARDVAPEQFDDVAAEVRTLLDSRIKILDALIRDYDTYLAALSALDLSERRLLDIATEFQRYIDERVLWVRSTLPLSVRAMGRAQEAFFWLLDRTHYTGLLAALRRDVVHRLALWIAAGLLFTLLFVGRFRMLHRNYERQSDGHMFYRTIQVWLWLAVVASPWPLVLLFLSWRLGSGSQSPLFVGYLAEALYRAAWVLWILKSVAAMTVENGRAWQFYRWKKSATAFVRRHIHWFTLYAVPAMVLMVVVRLQPNRAWHDALGRLLFMASMMAFGVFLTILMRPAGPMMKPVLDRGRDWLERLRYLWYPVVSLAPFAMAGAAAMGYYYTAGQLAGRMWQTTLLVVLTVLIGHTLTRWIISAQRRLALQRAQQRDEQRKAQAAATQAVPAPVSTPTAVVEPAEKSPVDNIYDLSRQSRRLLTTVLGLAMIAGLWVIWSDVLPALGALNRVELWQTSRVETDVDATVPQISSPQSAFQLPSAPAADTAADADVQETPVAIAAARPVAVTLADLLLALLVMALTVVTARNLPGFLQISILQRLPLDKGVCFAITTLTRYVLVVVGVILVFGLLGLAWSKIQWLVAAVTVGLGFGLQEIFANFVSGLIILFERPMRVGDTVTTGDITGRVSEIRIRATTIVNWDRKELIVPNREFITGRLVNWTLSDTILRMQFPVGVAYGSDTEKVERTLLRVARENATVLADPEPYAVFKAFGESSLDFELRVYIPNMDNYIKVWHQLNMTIDAEFRKAGIEIAFPQRDLHVRSFKPPVELFRREELEDRSQEQQ